MSDDGNGRLPGKWTAYTPDTDLDRIRALFEARHGYAPDQVVQAGPILLAGPIGGNGHKRPSLLARVQEAQVDVTPERARQLALQLEVVR